ncbi:MAG: DUF423 domain-containing protein [Saccharospirillum sp.]
MTAQARWLLLAGTVFAFSAVALGAFGGHALTALVPPERLATWHTAVRYQMFHATALLLLGVLSLHQPQMRLGAAAACLSLGIVAFSGSLYLLVMTGFRGLGILTPLGGVLFLIGWAVLGWRLIQSKADLP